MGRRRIVLTSLIALTAVLLTSAVAALAVVGGLPAPERPSELVAVAVDGGRDAVDAHARDRVSAVPVPASDTGAPVTIATVPRPVATTSPVTTGATAPPTAVCPAAPWCSGRIPAPEVAPSWTATANGVTVTARIEPAAPQVGDTVTISYTAEGPNLCCWVVIEAGGVTIHDSFASSADHTCPSVPSVTTGSTRMVMNGAGDFSFRLGAFNGHLCQGPEGVNPSAGGAHLSPTFWVNPLP